DILAPYVESFLKRPQSPPDYWMGAPKYTDKIATLAGAVQILLEKNPHLECAFLYREIHTGDAPMLGLIVQPKVFGSRHQADAFLKDLLIIAQRIGLDMALGLKLSAHEVIPKSMFDLAIHIARDKAEGPEG